MKALYLDIFSGISGDMFLGAMLDLGVKAGYLENELGKLGLDGYHIHITRQQTGAINGVKFDVHLESEHQHGHRHDHEHHRQNKRRASDFSHEGHGRSFADIRRLITRSKLSPWVKERSVSVFGRIAAAEAKVHGCEPEAVHFHEVGALDSIVDIVGACVALDFLGRPVVLAAPVVDGTGWVTCAHGRFPVPTAATLEILGARGVAVTQCEEPAELVTPTGAALLAEFVQAFGPMRNLVAERIGYGLGTRQLQTRPNCLRAVLGEVSGWCKAPAADQTQKRDWETDTVAVLETNLDNISGEVLGHFMELALSQGALDVFYTPIQMKKNRPGVLLTILCPENEAEEFTELVMRETSALGVRRTIAERRKLKREVEEVETAFGKVAVKTARLNGRLIQASPEFESCKKAAGAAGVPVKQVYAAAIKKMPLR